MADEAEAGGYLSLEEAARGAYAGFPASRLPGRMLHSVISPRQVAAVVLFEAEPYEEEGILHNRDSAHVVVCERRNGRWFPAWGPETYLSTSRHPRGSTGLVHRAGCAVPGATAVLVRYRAREYTVEVSESGHFIFAAWKVPMKQWLEDSPAIVGYVMEDGSRHADGHEAVGHTERMKRLRQMFADMEERRKQTPPR